MIGFKENDAVCDLHLGTPPAPERQAGHDDLTLDSSPGFILSLSQESAMSNMTIGRLAKQAGVSIVDRRPIIAALNDEE